MNGNKEVLRKYDFKITFLSKSLNKSSFYLKSIEFPSQIQTEEGIIFDNKEPLILVTSFLNCDSYEFWNSWFKFHSKYDFFIDIGLDYHLPISRYFVKNATIEKRKIEKLEYGKDDLLTIFYNLKFEEIVAVKDLFQGWKK